MANKKKEQKVKYNKNELQTDKIQVSASQLVVEKKCRYPEMVAKFFAIVFLCLFPLCIDQNLYLAITEAKFHFFEIFAGAFIAVELIFIVVIYLSKNDRQLRWSDGHQSLTQPQILILLYVIWSSFTAIISDYGADCLIGQSRYEGLVSIVLYAGIFFLMSYWGEYNDKLFYGIGLMAIILGFIGVCQIFGKTWIYPEQVTYWTSHFLTTIGNIDCVSGVIAAVVPVLFCAYVLMEDDIRYIFIPGVVLLMFNQFVCDVDGGKLGLLLAFAVSLPFIVDTKRKAGRTAQMLGVVTGTYAIYSALNFVPVTESTRQAEFSIGGRFVVAIILTIVLIAGGIFLEKQSQGFKLTPKQIRKYVALVLVAIVIIGFIFIFVYNGSNVLLHDLHEASHFRLSDEAGSGRGYIYKYSIETIKQHPLLGTGPGTFVAAFDPYNAGWQVMASGQRVDFPHCDLLMIATCEGLVGLIIYLLFLASLIYKALKNAPRFTPIVIMGASLAGYLMYSFFTFSIAIVTPIFWVMAGLLDKTIRQLPNEEVKQGKTDRAEKKAKKEQ